MKVGSSLALICLGAILAFAVTGHISFINLHTAGWVFMLIGVIGMLLPNRTAGWLGRRLLVRRTYPGGRVEQIPVSPYAARNPGTPAIEAGLPARPTLIDEDNRDLIEEVREPGYPAGTRRPPSGGAPGYRPAGQRANGTTEVIEDLYEQP